MAYLTDANNIDSDSDDLPAVNTVLQGNSTVQNEDSMRVTGGSSDRDVRDIRIKSYRLDTRAKGGIRRIQKNGKKEMRDKCNLGVNKIIEDTHSGSLEGKKARRFRRVILDESDDQDRKEPEVEKDGRNAEVPILLTRSKFNKDGHHTRKREMAERVCDTSEIAPLGRIWKITHASRYSDSDEETGLESEGDLEARFANIRLLCDRSSSNKNHDGDRLSFGSNNIGVEAGVKQIVRPVTPEQNSIIHGDKSHSDQPEAESRTESRLVSPSKRKQQQQQPPRIPSTPECCESGENFWRQSFINEWNDLYSPKKEMLSPKKFPPDKQHDSLKLSDFCNNGRGISSLVAKPDKETVRRKKLFRATKHIMAETFLAEIDREVTGGHIAELSRTTGGVKLIWSKKLVSTAGRAHWKRIKPKTGGSSDDFGASEQHYASIELAEKVIDNENRLKNVIAHEFCHLANFMISDVKDNPHGRSFKEWYFYIFHMLRKDLIS